MRNSKRWTGYVVAALLMQLAAWSVTGASAQPADHGISERQSQASLQELIDDFVGKQVVTNDYSKIRYRVYNVTRVYNQKLGWITIAEFDGAIVSDKSDPGEVQKFYHGLIKIVADENGMPQAPVINEGQGYDIMEGRVARLRDELTGVYVPPRSPSQDDSPPAASDGGSVPSIQQGMRTPSSGDEAIKKKYAELRAIQAKCRDQSNPNRQKDCEEYQRLYREMNAAK